MSARVVSTAAVLLIGNELLSGKVHEANLVELARALRALGIRLRRVVIVPDETELIAAEVRALAAGHDVVFTSGGVGPTHDDVTLDAVAAAFGVRAVVHPEFEAVLARAYGPKMTDAHRRMALAPEGAVLAHHEEARWPTVVMQNVWVLPGVPEAFRMKLATIRAHLTGPRPIVTRELLTQLEEPELKPLLDAVVAAHPTVEIGSYPRWFEPTYRTKITFDSTDAAAVDRALAALEALLPGVRAASPR